MRPSTNSTLANDISKTSSDQRTYPPKANESADVVGGPAPAKEALEDKDAESLERTRKADSDTAWDMDPANPRNWSLARKWKNLSIVSFYACITPLASSMMAPGLPAVAVRYDITSPTVVALSLSIYLLAFAMGPLVLGPLSEMYGRTWVLHSSIFLFIAFTFGCIFAPNVGSLIVFRFLAGLGGSTPVSIGGGTVSDVFNDKERGTAMSIYSIGPLLGPVLGPIVGGFVVQTIGIRWIFILLTLLSSAAAIVAITLLEETYAPAIKETLMKARAKDVEAGTAVAYELPPKISLGQSLRLNLSRPFLLLTRSLICFMLSLYMALIYGYLYLMFTTFPDLFSGIYGWGPGVSGLAYLGPGIGFMIATVIGAKLLSKVYDKLCARNGGRGKPEFRIPVMFLGSALVPIGLLWYGWSAQARTHFIMPIIGSGIYSGGMMFVFIPLQLYLVDAFTYAASALAAASVFRALFAFAFPLFGEQMFAALGFGGGNSLLAGLAFITGIPFPLWLYYKGEEMRLRNPLNR
ncbi:MFS general substrate transporter [Ramaria rubella]|nr:MFS general substrate transporter [Ramaria rubella]